MVRYGEPGFPCWNSSNIELEICQSVGIQSWMIPGIWAFLSLSDPIGLSYFPIMSPIVSQVITISTISNLHRLMWCSLDPLDPMRTVAKSHRWHVLVNADHIRTVAAWFSWGSLFPCMAYQDMNHPWPQVPDENRISTVKRVWNGMDSWNISSSIGTRFSSSWNLDCLQRDGFLKQRDPYIYHHLLSAYEPLRLRLSKTIMDPLSSHNSYWIILVQWLDLGQNRLVLIISAMSSISWASYHGHVETSHGTISYWSHCGFTSNVTWLSWLSPHQW